VLLLVDCGKEQNKDVAMLIAVRKTLIKWLGGHTKEEYNDVEVEHSELVRIRHERDQYKAFAESLATYCDTYPMWAAQREFRHHMQEIGQPLSAKHPHG
jgi:hypothetical protein